MNAIYSAPERCYLCLSVEQSGELIDQKSCKRRVCIGNTQPRMIMLSVTVVCVHKQQLTNKLNRSTLNLMVCQCSQLLSAALKSGNACLDLSLSVALLWRTTKLQKLKKPIPYGQRPGPSIIVLIRGTEEYLFITYISLMAGGGHTKRL